MIHLMSKKIRHIERERELKVPKTRKGNLVINLGSIKFATPNMRHQISEFFTGN